MTAWLSYSPFKLSFNNTMWKSFLSPSLHVGRLWLVACPLSSHAHSHLLVTSSMVLFMLILRGSLLVGLWH